MVAGAAAGDTKVEFAAGLERLETPFMKICIFGAGAIGGYLAAELTRAGADVCAIARGAHLNAIKAHGLTLHAAGETRHVPVTVSDDAAEFGPQDFVVCSLKAHQASDDAEALAPLLGPVRRSSLR